jgi:arylsulfate sulfotransferase
MAPHRGWGTAGNGVDLNTKLLTPLDKDGNPISDPDVLDGAQNHPDFEWNWYQHAPKVMPDKTIILFDDGDKRNYAPAGTYSRAVQYKIDEEAMTIQQLWQYGKERGPQTFSSFVSEVDYDQPTGRIVFSSGAINNDGPRHGKIIEIEENTSNVVFEATIVPPQTTGVTFHRSQRLSLYR